MKEKVSLVLLTIFISFMSFSMNVLAIDEPFRAIDNSGTEMDCSGLLSADAIAFLKKAFLVVKIIAPLALIAYSMYDFFMAITSANDDAFLKAGKKFWKRLFIAIAIFLIPTFVEFVANITGLFGTCGIN